MYSVKIKTTAVLAFATLLCINTKAQQLFKLSQYMDHNFIHNPAATGANEMTTVGGVFRSQWSGIDGSPQTFILFGDTYMERSGIGLGGVIYADKTGPTSRNSGQFNFSYTMKLDDKGKKLMLGFGAQALQFKVDKNKIAEFIPNDPLLSAAASSTKADASAGIYFRTPRFTIGASAMQILQPKLNFIKSSTSEEGKLYRHFFFNTSYRINTDEDNVLIPHFELRYQPNAPADYEGGIMLVHKDLINVGVNIHHKQDYSIFAGLKLNHKFFIGYCYDVYNNPINTFEGGNGAHELMLRYFFVK
ncbi:PorP/SprF family type IX secretion system membrane protein [Ferruginibacter sp.]